MQNQEFTDGSGLELYSTDFRSYDPQIGRFHQVDPMAEEAERFSPFVFANNSPILLNDPKGLLSDSSHPVVLAPVTVTATFQKKESDNRGAGTFAFGGAIPLGGGVAEGVLGGAATSSTGIGALIGAAVWARVKVGEFARKFEEKRFYVTYYKVGPGGKIYVGRCSGYGKTAQEVLDKYDKTHRMNAAGYGQAVMDRSISGSVFSKLEKATGMPAMPGLVDPGSEVIITEISGYAAIRGREQQLYASYKNAGASMGNIQNPVWEYNPLNATYYAASNLAFGPLVNYNDLYK
ncbi:MULTISPECIES: RHS repeat-associated core domain-containing protein [Niastella]|uniref:RHS repeat-associated core domain-containing protein n=1 Tax=Niastella soli TaxID=2821487 RepID=A0ABS3Z521_9BACT|nr:RHS repeat-associated core domain-containing protein [Niastella soli]MBO9205246.1 hypothetical protein [Niastella soli]